MKKLTAEEILYDIVSLHPGLLNDTDVEGSDLISDLSNLLNKYKGLKLLPKEEATK